MDDEELPFLSASHPQVQHAVPGVSVTERVLRKLHLLSNTGTPYSLAPLRARLQDLLHEMGRQGCPITGSQLQCNSSFHSLAGAVEWSAIVFEYNTLWRVAAGSFFEGTESERARVNAVIDVIDQFAATLQPGDFGYTSEEMSVMAKWDVQPRN